MHSTLADACEAAAILETCDPVCHPQHYTGGPVECIDALESAIEGLQGAEALLTAQAIKYLWRWKWKHEDGVTDLRKAEWYLQRLIRRVEGSE